MVTSRLKSFLINNQNLIKSKKYDELYEECNLTLGISLSELTDVLYKSGIEPLNYLTLIPEEYAYSISSIPSTININQMIVGVKAFDSCSNLLNVTFEPTVRILDNACFRDTISLKRLHINEGVDTIGEYAFYQSGIEEIYLPSTLMHLGIFALHGCKNLKRLIFNGTKEEFLKLLDQHSQGDLIFKINTNKIDVEYLK